MMSTGFIGNIVTDYRFYSFIDKLVGQFINIVSSTIAIIAFMIVFIKKDTLQRWRKAALIILVPLMIIAFAGIANVFTNHFTINPPSDEGLTYIGNLNNKGKPDGFIKVFDDNQQLIYVGMYKNGYRHGKGKVFTTEEINGNQITYASYEGEFVQGKKHGSGKTFICAGNEVKLQYEGEFDQDDANVSKAVFYAYDDDGTLYSVYEGGWSNGSRCEYGVYQRFDKVGDCTFRYRGTLWDGEFSGLGKLEYYGAETDNKYVYVGKFKSDDFNGQGVIYDESGNYIEGGIFKDDMCIKEDDSLQAEYPFPVDCLWQESQS